MNYRQRYQDILDFLRPYQRIWQNEIMLQYPSPLEGYPPAWIEELASFHQKDDLLKLEKKQITGLVQNIELRELYQRIQELEEMPKAPFCPKMPERAFTFLYVTPKKQHEIRQLAPIIHEFSTQHNVSSIVDIGGGIGLLAQTLNNEYHLPVTTLDANPVLQQTGKSRHLKNARDPDHLVEYIHLQVNQDSPQFYNLLGSDCMTVGLHTCGILALDQIMASAKRDVKVIINLGCCFHHLENQSHQNISAYAQSQGGLYQNRFALTLASRGHLKIGEKDFDLKQKVKLYRYAMHFLLHDEYQIKTLVTLGNSHPKLYDESFGYYALEQLKRIQITPKHSQQELNDYYQRPGQKELIWKMLAAGLIRNAFGRLLELVIHLDRGFYLEEQGYEMRIWDMFDEPLSPRNLGVLAWRP